MITKANYLERRETSLRVLELEIARLTDYADRAKADVADKYYEAIRSLQATHDNAAEMLQKLHAASDESWMREDAATDVEEAWRELREAVIAAISMTYCEANRRSSRRHAANVSSQANRAHRAPPRGACY